MNSTTVRHLVSCLVLGGLLVLALGSDDSSSRRDAPSAGKAPSQTNPTGEKRISGENWFGCTDREYFSKLVDYAVQDDQQAFSQALATGVVAGVCTTFTNGENVFITDTAVFSGLVKVRRRGEITEYWTNLEAIK